MSPPVPVLRFPGPSPLWASGRFVLRVGGERSGWRSLAVTRPYATVGREPGNEVVVDEPGVAPRHLYLHLDRRGLYAVDLASRGGTRIGRDGRLAGWIAPGEVVELGGRKARIELVELLIDEPEPLGPGGFDLLSDTPPRPLARVTLFPDGGSAVVPLVLHSELVFVGRSPACGVVIDDPAAAAVQCVLVRDEVAAYVVDLGGRSTTWINSRPLREASIVRDGDRIVVGGTRLECRIEVDGSMTHLPATTPMPPAAGPSIMATPEMMGTELSFAPPPGTLMAGESQEQLMAWLLGMMQATQGELLRRQSQFQDEVVQSLRQIQGQHADSMSRHRDQIGELHRELSGLRDDVRRRFAAGEPARPAPLAGPGVGPGVPPRPPLPSPPSAPTGTPGPGDDGTAAAWLVRKIDEVKRDGRGRRK